MSKMAVFIDHSRCVECEVCVVARSARKTHCGFSMISVNTTRARARGLPLAVNCGVVQ
jgi:Fe-S-cluster-containing dehydrogenase component